MKHLFITLTILVSAVGLFFSVHEATAQSGKTVYWFTLEHLDRDDFKTGYTYRRSPEFDSMLSCIEARPAILKDQLIDPNSLSGDDLTKSQCISGTYAADITAGFNCTNTGGKLKCDKPYTLLSKLPGLDSVDETTTFGQYLNIIFKLVVGLTTIGAVVMIIFGGMQYMTTDAFTGKAAGIERIKTALWGLILALFSWVILFTINPDLLNLNFIQKDDIINVKVGDEPEIGIPGVLGNTEIGPLPNKIGTPVSIRSCDESVMTTVTAFGGKTFQIYKGLAPSIMRIDAVWNSQPAETRYKVESIGGYDCRTVAGTGTISAHAFGMAVDINPDQNPHTKNGTQVTDIPPSFSNLFKSEGWGWGGDWATSSDPMHFSKYPLTEYGDAQVETITSLSTGI